MHAVVKFFSAKTKSQPAAGSVAAEAPGDYFFVRRFDLPAGMAASEVGGFVGLQLEELSPFPLEQLYHGHAISRDGSAVVVYAAYRRRFSAEQVESWKQSLFVMPDFGPALRLKFERDTVVFLRSAAALSALRFEEGRELPVRVASRPLAPAASDEEVARVRAELSGAVGSASDHRVDLRLTSLPQQRAQGLVFVLGPDNGRGSAEEVTIPTSECWAMDIRDAEFVAQQRRRLGFDLVLWRVVQGAAATVAILLIGEVILLGVLGYATWLSGRVASQAPVVAALEDKDTVANRLTDFGRSGVSPFAMLTTAWGQKPASVYFTRVIAEGRNNLVLEASTQNVADVSQYETALRTLAEVEKVEVRNQRSRDDGTTFSVAIAFRAGSFARSAGGVATAGGIQ